MLLIPEGVCLCFSDEGVSTQEIYMFLYASGGVFISIGSIYINTYQSMKRLNYHSDIVLRTPTLSSGERMLMMANTDPMNSFNSIMSTAYPEHGVKVLDWMEDLRVKANRNILMIHMM